jgi:hypothetical protein
MAWNRRYVHHRLASRTHAGSTPGLDQILRHPEPGGKPMIPAEDGGGQNARATSGPGILPVTKRAHWISRISAKEPHIPSTGQDV